VLKNKPLSAAQVDKKGRSLSEEELTGVFFYEAGEASDMRKPV
jgi:hypothetical protein